MSELPLKLWTRDGFGEDRWVHAESLDDHGANACVILPLENFLALDEKTMAAREGCLGVRIEPGEELEAIEDRLDSIALVALAFPAFADGRSFSKAALLHSRHGYSGAIRAVGDVLIDQIPLMLRSGFTEFEVSHETTVARLEAGRVGGIDQHYQPAAVAAAKGATYSWRRTSAA